jgi:ABC-type branched-subunit amino acid transport system substrate-binding protein
VGNTYSYTTAINSSAAALGKTPSQLRWAFVGRAEPSGQTITENYTALAKAEGANVVYSKAPIPVGGGGDLQPFVSAIMDTKPDIVWEMLGAEAIGLTSALTAAGYTGTTANASFYSPGLFAKVPSIGTALNGAIIQASTPVLESGSPQVKQLVKDYQAIGKTEADITFGGEYGWMTADLMIAMMKKVAPNFDKLVPTLSKNFAYKPMKNGVPFNWPSAYDSAGACTTMVKVVDSSKYEIVTPFNCKGKKVENKAR